MPLMCDLDKHVTMTEADNQHQLEHLQHLMFGFL